MSLWQELKQAWDALSHADQGELQSFEDKCAVLGVAPREDFPRYVPHQHRGPHKQIGLYVEDHLAEWLLEYALKTCKVEDAGLLLLSLKSPATLHATLQAYLPRIHEAAIPFKFAALDGGLPELRACLFNHRRVQYVITNNRQIFNHALLTSVPLIFVASMLDL